ncbi:MAG: chorismate-binding protein, partial [Clostridia bacterium]|nr:chorismate-binding protein [Clostridia bacterium]
TFTGGFVGYFAYEYYKYAEKIDLPAGVFGDARLFIFDKVVAYDNVKHKIVVLANVSLYGDLEENYRAALEELQRIKQVILTGCKRQYTGAKVTSPFQIKFGKEEYMQKVERAKRYTFEGDIFQCVPSNRWTATVEGGLLNAYRVLRTTNPSPYMIYMIAGDTEIAGASPETLVKLTGKKVATFPIAGTRPRGKTDEEDRALEAGLLQDEKEIAEHNMLVDLGRNDLGKVCKFGSVRVEDYQKIYRFSHVMHITSSVVGEICDDKDGLDALSATLPAGTLSGAPKKRAVEIIHELEEGEPRGIYGGAVGYLDFMGNCDFCIAIRTATRKGNEVSVRAGGGIVEGSVPESEYLETCNKSAAPREAIIRSQEVDL